MIGLTLDVPNTTTTFAERVFAKVDASGDCWIWTGGNGKDGYGVIGRGRAGAGTVPAHSAVWQLLVGPVGAGLEIDHLCRNRLCVNPDHLEPVTHQENMRRAPHPNAVKTKCKSGHAFDAKNTYVDGRGRRNCRACNRSAAARVKARRLALIGDKP